MTAVQEPPSFLLLGDLVEEQLSRQVVRMPDQSEESSLTSQQPVVEASPEVSLIMCITIETALHMYHKHVHTCV